MILLRRVSRAVSVISEMQPLHGPIYFSTSSVCPANPEPAKGRDRMKNLKYLFVALVASMTLGVQAVVASPQKPLSRHAILMHFYKDLLKSKSLFSVADIKTNSLGELTCKPETSCVDASCKYAGDCQYSSDLQDIIKACKGVNGDCVESACKYAGDCQYDSDRNQIIAACKSASPECVEAACKYAGDCNYDSDLENIMKLCVGVDGSCVAAACKYSNNCNYDSDFRAITSACKNEN